MTAIRDSLIAKIVVPTFVVVVGLFFSTKKSGTGLGLYVARQIVQTQRGDITVTSELGRGACFTVRVPATGRSEVRDVES